MLVGAGTMDIEWGLLGAAALALPNTLTGVFVHQALLRGIRHARAQGPDLQT